MSIGSAPVLDKGIGAQIPDRGPIQNYSASDRASMVAPKNHYPLVTPDGTVPVEELALHGRYRNDRSRWYSHGPDYVAMDAGYAEYELTAEERLAADTTHREFAALHDNGQHAVDATMERENVPDTMPEVDGVTVIRGGEAGSDTVRRQPPDLRAPSNTPRQSSETVESEVIPTTAG